MSRHKSMLSTVAALCLLATVAVPAGVALASVAPAPVTFLPIDDAYVAQANPNTNYGNASVLLTDKSPVLGSFLRFDVTTDAPVTSARLRLFTTDATKNGPKVFL